MDRKNKHKPWLQMFIVTCFMGAWGARVIEDDPENLWNWLQAIVFVPGVIYSMWSAFKEQFEEGYYASLLDRYYQREVWFKPRPEDMRQMDDEL